MDIDQSQEPAGRKVGIIAARRTGKIRVLASALDDELDKSKPTTSQTKPVNLSGLDDELDKYRLTSTTTTTGSKKGDEEDLLLVQALKLSVCNGSLDEISKTAGMTKQQPQKEVSAQQGKSDAPKIDDE